MLKLQLIQACLVLMAGAAMGSIINEVLMEADMKAKKPSPRKRFCHQTPLFHMAYDQLIHDFKDMIGGWCLTEVKSDVDTNYYYFSKPQDACNWHGAHDYCQAHGMNLARVDTVPDLMALLAAAEEHLHGPDDFFWIGLNDQANEGVFEWSYMQGNKTSDAWLPTWGWFADEPTSTIYNPLGDGKNENCVSITKRESCVRFADCNCHTHGRFICRANPVYRSLLNSRCRSRSGSKSM